MLQYEFMRNALIVATVISILCGIMGVFITARHLSFLTHTMSEIGFSGASFGMLFFTVLSALAAGMTNRTRPLKGTVISTISAFFMGLGVLFLSIAQTSSSYATNILFGSIVGISQTDVQQISLIAVFELILIVFIYRQLKFEFFDPIGAQESIRFNALIILSIIFALLGTWIGLFLGYLTNLPVTFFITTIETIIYLISRMISKFRN